MKFLQKSLLSLSVAALAAFAMTGQTSATPVVTQWDYVVTTEFSGQTWEDRGAAGIDPAASATGDEGVFSNSTVLSWGGNGTYATPINDIDIDRSALTLDSVAQDGVALTNVVEAPTSSITHYNNAISVDFDWLDGAQITTAIDLNPNLPVLGVDVGLPSIIFDIDFKETLNSGACSAAGATVCPDIFVLSGATSLSQEFAVGFNTYEISIIPVGGALFGLPAGACVEAGAAPGCIGFTTEEQQATNLLFGFVITQVPEPGTLSLLGLGLVGGAVLRRRKTA